MHEICDAELRAVTIRLKAVVTEIVTRHRSKGDKLTWRLMHDIEDEAFDRLNRAGDLDPSYIQMFKSSKMMPYRRTETPVDFGESNAIPAAFLYIERAFTRFDA